MSGPRTVASFSIEYLQVLGANGHLHGKPPPIAAERERLVALYRAMVLTRTFDARAVALQRTGQLGTFASSLGQEAVGVGVAAAMAGDDVLLPSFREQGAQLLRGVSALELLLYWGGDERGSHFAACREDFPVCIPVGSHAPHAAGVALAFKLRGERRAAVCMFGDGATSKGDVYEAMNFAGVHALPVLFVVSNNQWAISVPRAAQSACQTLAQKAIGAGITGLQVDGNDVLAVHEATRRALERARAGGGPTLLEALTYRLSDHTTADDASRYRDDAEVSEHWQREPLARLRDYLVAAGWWRRDDEDALLDTCRGEVEDAVKAYLGTAPQPPTSMFDHLHAALPAALAGQRASVADADDTE